MLARKLEAFNAALGDPDCKSALRATIHSYVFSQLAAGPQRSPVLRGAMQLMVDVSLKASGPLVLIYFLVAALPLHNVGLVWWLRFVFVADLAIVILVSGFLTRPSGSFRQVLADRFSTQTVSTYFRFVAYPAVLFLVFFVTTIPDEGTDWLAAQTVTVERSGRPVFAPTAWLLEGHVNVETGERTSPFSRNYDLRRFDFRTLAPKRNGSGSEEKAKPQRNQIDERRPRLPRLDLRYALLSGAIFRGLDLKHVRLDRAVLFEADLQEANLSKKAKDGGTLRGVNFDDADLRRADLSKSDLIGASFRTAQLQGANLNQAQLEGADLSDAQMQGANLNQAQLQGADLSEAQMQGADLVGSGLQGADLSKVSLRGAAFSGTELQGADLSYAELKGAILIGSSLGGADLTGADLKVAILYEVAIWNTRPPEEEDLSDAHLTDLALVEPTAEELSRLAKVVENIADKGVRARVAQRLQPLFDATERTAWKGSWEYEKWTAISDLPRPALVKQCTLFAKMACYEDLSGHFTRNIAELALFGALLREFQPYARRLASELLDESCKAGAVLAAETRSQLQELANKAPRASCADPPAASAP